MFESRVRILVVYGQLLAGLSALLIGLGTTVAKAQTRSLPVTTEAWDGFGDDFNPYWAGDKKRVQWSRYSSSAAIMLSWIGSSWDGYRGDLVFYDKPIELIRSSRSSSVNSQARSVVPGDYADAESKTSPSTRLEGPWTQKLAQYAEVVDLDDLVLSSGRSVAEQVSDVADEFFSVDGRVAAATMIDLVDRTNSTASALASSVFEADYLVNHPVSFDLSGVFSGRGDVDFDFLVRNNRTGELVYSFRPDDFGSLGLSYSFSVAGELEPGSYKFSVSALSDSRISTYGGYESGDLGEFLLDFSAVPIGEFVAPPVGIRVPEPGSLAFVGISLIATGVMRCRLVR